MRHEARGGLSRLTYPTGRGEKIICLKNRHDLGLVNGMFLTLSDVRHEAGTSSPSAPPCSTEDGQEIAGRPALLARANTTIMSSSTRERGRRDCASAPRA